MFISRFLFLLLLGSFCFAPGLDVMRAIDQVCNHLATLAGQSQNNALLMQCRTEIIDANHDVLADLTNSHEATIEASNSSQSNVQCIEDRPHGLCLVDMDKFPFAPPNMQVPEPGRGVVFVIAPDESTGWTNPSIDLNRLAPNTGAKAGTFWVDGAAPQYQTWLDLKGSYGVFESQKLSEIIGVRNELNITADGPQVQISFFWGHVHVPASVFLSPTLRVSEHEFNRSLVVFGKTVGEWPGYRVVGADGQRTKFYTKMVEHCGGKAVTRPNTEQSSTSIV
jgi:hypothetical protein